MEWVETTEEHNDGHEGRHEPFEVLKETPHQLTSRVKAISAAEEDQAAAALGEYHSMLALHWHSCCTQLDVSPVGANASVRQAQIYDVRCSGPCTPLHQS